MTRAAASAGVPAHPAPGDARARRSPGRLAYSGATAGLARLLKPSDPVFFELFEEASANMLEAAVLIEQMITDFPARAAIAQDLLERERTGDRITRALVDRLNSKFVLPMDREDIFRLAASVNDVVDFIEEAADSLDRYHITAILPEAKSLARVLVAACRQLDTAFAALRDFGDLSAQTIEVHRLENEGEHLVHNATAALFASNDVQHVVRWKAVFEHLEHAIDATEDAASLIEGIVLKHS
jgi:uncharacterized protein Yka (UPF0111/DUF47 family)